MDIKPIKTRYGIHSFRSRLEARWAVFFDMIGCRYEYEKEGYKFGDYKYLPDFYLPDNKIYVEIKGEKPSMKYMSMLQAFSDSTGNPVILAVGYPNCDAFQLYCIDYTSSSGGTCWFDAQIINCKDGVLFFQVNDSRIDRDRELFIMNYETGQLENLNVCYTNNDGINEIVLNAINESSSCKFEKN